MKNYIWHTIAVIAVLILGASIIYSNSVSKNADEGIAFSEHVKGNPESLVILTEFSDFQCPACAQFSGVMEQVLEQYGADIRFEYKHFPLTSIHKNSIPAAKAAEAAGQQGKFFPMHDALFANQNVWAEASNPQAYFVKYAEEIGLDITQFKTQMKSLKINEKVAQEMHQAQELGLHGTPTFFLNGERMQFKTLAEFTGLVETAISQSKEQSAGVTDPETLFEGTDDTTGSDKSQSTETEGSFGF